MKKQTGRRKKPTMMEVKDAINGLILRVNELQQYQTNMDRILTSYINFNKHEDGFKEYLIKIREEIENVKNNPEEQDVERFKQRIAER
tara:strand:+ start:453 stop:716 length:264 start_codon:yes stop_codon:yes gene_type:complete